MDELIDEVLKSRTVKSNKGATFFNVPASFDIEVTSLEYEGRPHSVMYEWTFGVNGLVMIGRTWGQFLRFLERLTIRADLGPTRRLVVYVHNLQYEFQFIRKLLEWDKVFAIDERRPLYAITKTGIEFRCSFLLSGMSLARVGENLQKWHMPKMVGDLDYDLIRSPATSMTGKELGYCINDVRCVMAYIQEKLEEHKFITRIPLTKTGYVRKYCRERCFYGGAGHHKYSAGYGQYRAMMDELTLDGAREYRMAKEAFQGGFTHCSAWKQGKVWESVASYDECSAYPSVMVCERFPMSRGEKITITGEDHFRRQLALYCCLFVVRFHNIRPKLLQEHYISSSRCHVSGRCIRDNGRIVSADELTTTITEQDWDIIERFYEWDSVEIGEFYRYRRGYLPTRLVRAVLDLYRNKTTLKGVAGKELEYAASKAMVNSVYGMSVTDICRPVITYTDEWNTEPADIAAQIGKYNESPRRFLSYLWGVWVTAYARRNVLAAIEEFGSDYIYTDTDSVKGLHPERHQEWLRRYNAEVHYKMERAMRYHDFPLDDYKPKTIKGVEKPLGVFECDGVYSRFKSLGAKRYMVEYAGTGDMEMTVSGINKKVCMPFLRHQYGDNTAVFDAFQEGLYIPSDKTGKQCHRYLDEPFEGIATDYQGNQFEYHELSGINIGGSDYDFTLAQEYADFLHSIRLREI